MLSLFGSTLLNDENYFESNLSKFYCHCLIYIPLNMHKNKFHVCLHIFVDTRELRRCIHCDLKEYTRKRKK